MGSIKRLNYICKTIETFYPKLIDSEASTLFINYSDASDLNKITLPNINYYSDFATQQTFAKKLGLVTLSKINKKYEIVVVTVSKSKLESFGRIAIAYETIKFGGILIIDGSKRNGIDSIIKILSKIVDLEHINSKDHGKTAILTVLGKKIDTFADWSKYSKPIKNEDGYFSVPGLFSYRKIDPASEFLSSIFDDQLRGNIIDLGAGWGFLSAKVIKKCKKIKSITLIDHDQRAINCARMNIKNKKASFRCLDVKEATDLGLKFDNVISNPPFHSNQCKDLNLGKSFIRVAHRHLKSTGSLFIVSNIQLPYERLAQSLFRKCTIHLQNRKFKIILATGPKNDYDILSFEL